MSKQYPNHPVFTGENRSKGSRRKRAVTVSPGGRKRPDVWATKQGKARTARVFVEPVPARLDREQRECYLPPAGAIAWSLLGMWHGRR